MPRTKMPARKPVVRTPGAGRRYEMGPLEAVFKADGEETRNKYSISEFEPQMKSIAKWFIARSPADSRTANAPKRRQHK